MTAFDKGYADTRAYFVKQSSRLEPPKDFTEDQCNEWWLGSQAAYDNPGTVMERQVDVVIYTVTVLALLFGIWLVTLHSVIAGACGAVIIIIAVEILLNSRKSK